jgi:hypothetical protein
MDAIILANRILTTKRIRLPHDLYFNNVRYAPVHFIIKLLGLECPHQIVITDEEYVAYICSFIITHKMMPPLLMKMATVYQHPDIIAAIKAQGALTDKNMLMYLNVVGYQIE